ncbi:MAG: hypothetical protein NC132_02410 [Corallococcus sp.]|nr:hypothetical protein [Corallococcus sp.]MCM1358961.1 hypothetical protein [Corallococcus sp.]MCM1394950.1 hypothetical protein [Corallococcus sp.]
MAKKTINNIGTIDFGNGKRLVVAADKIVQAIGENKKVVNAVLKLKGIDTLNNCKITAACGCSAEKTVDCITAGQIVGESVACVNVTHEIDCILKNSAEKAVFKFDKIISCGNIDLEVEYLPQQIMHRNNAYLDVDAGSAGKGKINVASGNLRFTAAGLVYNGWQAGKRKVTVDDAKDGRRNFDTHCGKGWKPFLSQYIVKRACEGDRETYTYVDGDGNYHEFEERYYYLRGDTKVYVNKSDVTVDLNGKLCYSGEEVKLERRTTSGLTLETDYSGFHKGSLLEQRQSEQIELEENVEAYKNQLKQYVVISKQNGETLRAAKNDDGELNCDERFAESVDDTELLLTETEAIQYNSLLLQQTEALDGVGKYVPDEADDGGLVTELKKQLDSSRKELADYTKKVNTGTHERPTVYYQEYLNYVENLEHNKSNCHLADLYSVGNRGRDAGVKTEVNKPVLQLNDDANVTILLNHINGWTCDLQEEIERLNDDLASYERKKINGDNESEIKSLKELRERKDALEKLLRIFQKEFSNGVDKRQIAVTELETLLNDYLTAEQGKLVNEQIQLLVARSQNNKTDFAKYYKQYVNYLHQLETLYAQLPTRFVTSGNNVLGFNKDGLLTALLDNYENQTAIIYDVDKIVSVRDTENNETTFDYDKNGLLCKITDANERATLFHYDEDGFLTEMTAPNGETTTFTYCDARAAADTESVKRELHSVEDAYGRGVEFVYDEYCKVISAREFSRIHSVADGQVLSNAEAEYKTVANVQYKSAATAVVTDGKGVVTTYIFDRLGKPVTVFEGEYDDAGEITKAVTLEYADGKQSYSVREDTSAKNLLAAPAEDTLGGTERRAKRYVLDRYAFEEDETDYVFSAWVKADSAYVPDAKYADKDNEGFLTYQQRERKFKLRATVNYDNGEQDSYAATFDWLNTDWQYLTLPVEIKPYTDNGDSLPALLPFAVGTKRNIVSMELCIDYSYNLGEIQVDCAALRKGKWTYSTYDKEGKKLTDEDSASKSVTRYLYDGDKVVKQILTDRQGRTYTAMFEYNKQGSLVRSTNYQGIVEETVFDEKGRELKKITYNQDDPTSKLYQESKRDDRGAVTADVDESGLYDSVTYAYDKQGNVTVQTDGKGNGTAFGHKDGKLVSISGAADGEESKNLMHYTADFLTNASNGETEYNYTYDGFGRTTNVEIAGTEYASIKYANDCTASATLADGTTQTTETDKYGNTVRQDTVYADGDRERVTAEYDELQKPTKRIIDINGVTAYNVEYKYNDSGNVTSEVRDGNSPLTKEYGYNTDGDLQQTVYTVAEQHLKYVYETDGTPDKRNSKVVLPFEVEQRFAYDGLGRTREIFLGENLVKDIHYAKYGDHATNRVSSVWYGINGIRKDNTRYTYDKAGNIETITKNGKLVARYKYDGLNRLVREDNKHFGTFTYQYDSAGNILSKAKYAYTVADVLGEPIEVKDYAYRQHGWKDQLLAYNGERCEYDALGNPTVYRDRTLTWQGRRLLSYGRDNKSAIFTYDANGTRTSKTIKQNEQVVSQSKYIYDGNNLVAEQRNGSWLYYLYGVDGVAGFNYQDNTYLFRKNLQGDVTHIYTADGALVVQYAYDAWGNCEIVLDNTDKIGLLNPFRYRSYYFDEETNLYYLQTRYYDPEVARFLNADSIEYLDPETLGGLNLYAYCGNNPVIHYDPTGEIVLLCLLIGLLVGAVAGAVAGGVTAYNAAKDSGATGWELFGWTLLGVFGGAVIGGAFGALAGAGIGLGLGILGAGISALGAGLFGGLAVVGGTVLSGAIAALAGIGLVIVGGGIIAGTLAAVGNVVLMAKIPYHGEPNSTIQQGGSTGEYDENGNLIKRRDTTGKPHYIKELQKYFLPHTHEYRWKLIDGIWRIIEKIIHPF